MPTTMTRPIPPRPRRPAVDRVSAYAKAVNSGRLVAGPWVRKACAKHLAELAKWGTKADGGISPFFFSVSAASRVIQFIEEELVLADRLDADGLPLPFRLEPWQCFVIGSVFGWQARDGSRRFRTGYIECGKGAGKTSMAAAIGLYCLTADNEPFPEVYSVAVSQKQARLIWKDACRMHEHGPRLKDFVEKTAHTLVTPGGGMFEARSSEHRALEGLRPSCVLIDELHEHPDDQVVTKMRRGTKGRTQALIIEITNSGYDRLSICYQHHEYSTRVLDGVVEDPSWFSYVCALDEGDEPLTNPAVWPKANPNLGTSIQPRYLEEAVTEAQGMPAAQADVLRLNFCVWTDQRSAFIPSAQWAACRNPMTEESLKAFPCVAGLDLGESDDMSALAVIWRLGDDVYHVKCWIWTCESAQTRYRDRPYDVWKRQGALTVTPGDVTDYTVIRRDVATIARRLGVLKIAYDRRGALQLAQELQGDGLVLIEQPQGYYLSEATKKLGTLITAGKLTHDGHVVLDWMAGNLSIWRGSGGDIRPVKTAGPDKVDAVVAAIMALSHATMPAPAPKAKPSIYDTRDVFVLGLDDDRDYGRDRD